VSEPVRQLFFSALLASCWLLCASAHADGEQLMPGGAQSVARGGATVARPTDATAILQNPAGLVDVVGNQGLYGFDVAFDHICEEPYGYYGWGVYLAEERPGSTSNPDSNRSEFGDPAIAAYGRRRLDRVCNSAPIAPTPQLAFVLHASDRLAFGFGILAPVLVSGAQWGGADATISAGGEARPTPTRYQLVRQEAKVGYSANAAIAYRALPWLSFGLTLQAAGITADNYVVMALRAGTSPSNDMLAKLHVTDLFIPSLTFGAYARPNARWRFAGTFVWSQGFDGHGDLTYTTNYYHQGAVGSEAVPLTNDPVKLQRVRVSVPWTATLATRYAQPRASSPSDARDPLVREVWDIELDASYTANSLVAANRIEIANDFTLDFRRADGTPQMPLTVKQSDLQELSVARHGLDVIVVRLGGSANLVPGRLQVSGGGFFQTRSIDPSYASVDSYGFARGGLGLGVMVRIGTVDLMASYAHIFQEELLVAPPPHQPRDQATDAPESGFDQRIYEDGQLSAQPRTDPRAPAPSAADGVAKLKQSAAFESENLRSRVVNAGRYTANFNVLSLGVVHHF
jgi:hypothetical protein